MIALRPVEWFDFLNNFLNALNNPHLEFSFEILIWNPDVKSNYCVEFRLIDGGELNRSN